jgi:hypothetical protein
MITEPDQDSNNRREEIDWIPKHIFTGALYRSIDPERGAQSHPESIPDREQWP